MSLFARVGVVAVLLLGCGGKVEGQDGAEFEFTVKNQPSGAFSFESIINVEQDVSGAPFSVLVSVTLEVESPQGETLAFIEEVQADAVVSGKHTELVTLDSEGARGSSASMDIQYKGDLRPMFPDGHTIDVAWNGRIDPRFGPLPADGIKVTCRMGIGR
jgi:hypothetical protein